MKKIAILAVTLACLAFSTMLAQDGDTKEIKPERKERALPYRGTIGKIDLKKKTFTLRNKSNTEVRTFQTDEKTRFEEGKLTMKFENLASKLAVRGSCVKTGDRQYLARLVRWTPVKSESSPSKESQ